MKQSSILNFMQKKSHCFVTSFGYLSCLSDDRLQYWEFLGAFAKLRKVTIFRHVCPSVRMEQLCSHWTDFHEI